VVIKSEGQYGQGEHFIYKTNDLQQHKKVVKKLEIFGIDLSMQKEVVTLL